MRAALGDGITNQNLEEMTFLDETFDVFITQDVLEHVNSPEWVLLEITRTLKRGAYIYLRYQYIRLGKQGHTL